MQPPGVLKNVVKKHADESRREFVLGVQMQLRGKSSYNATISGPWAPTSDRNPQRCEANPDPRLQMTLTKVYPETLHVL